MTPLVSSNTDEFQKLMNVWLRKTSQELSKALNRRMFFLLARAYNIVPPKSPAQERAKIKAYMNEPLAGKSKVVLEEHTYKKGKNFYVGLRHRKQSGSVLRRRNLIVNARARKAGTKGFRGKAMTKAAGKLSSGAQGSVGFLKSGFARAIKRLTGSYSTFGRVDKKTGETITGPNQAMVKFAQDYGAGHNPADNIGIHRGAQANVYPASPGINPRSIVNLSYKFADAGSNGRPAFLGGYDKARGIVEAAVSAAISDERDELLAHLKGVVDECANQACLESPNGRAS